MRLLRVVAAAVVAVAGLAVPQSAAHGAVGPEITSLAVDVHVLQNNDALIDWQVSGSWPAGQVSIDFYSEALDDEFTAGWSTLGQTSGRHRVSPNLIFENAIYYATAATVNDGASQTTYQLSEDGPVIEDVWFAHRVAAPVVPAAPTMLADLLPGPGIGEIAVLCDEVDGNGLPILDYALRAVPVAGGGVITLTRPPTRCSDVISGLEPGAEYEVTATARTAVGQSEPSEVLVERSLSPKPEAPTGLDAVAGDALAWLSWTRAESYGDVIDYYAVEVVCDSRQELIIEAAGDEDAATFIEATGLANGCEGAFRVAAHTDKGWGPFSEWSEPFTPTSGVLPPAPEEVIALWSSTSGLKVWWAYNDDGTDPPFDYEVEVMLDHEVVASELASCCSWTLPAIDSALTHTVRVRALNSAGWSDWSQPFTAKGEPIPTEIDDLRVIGRYWRAAATWSEPDNGAAYGYRYWVNPGREAEVPGSVNWSTEPSATLDSMTPGDDYVVTVWGVNQFLQDGTRTSVLVEGTELLLKSPTSKLTPGVPVEVRGLAHKTFDEAKLGGVQIVLQRLNVDGTKYRSMDVGDVTGGRGRFSFTFEPRRDAQYRVALVGQVGLGGSALALPASN